MLLLVELVRTQSRDFGHLPLTHPLINSMIIDVPLLNNVINYDFPPTPKLFVHRVGRAARMGRTGTAYSLVSYDEVSWLVIQFTMIINPILTVKFHRFLI